MSFEEILYSTRFSSSETAEQLMTIYKASGQLDKIEKRNENELLNFKQKYPYIPSKETAISIMKIELTNYAKKIIDAINKDYGHLIPKERINNLQNLLNNNIVIIDDPQQEHDFTAFPEKGQLVVNFHNIEKNKDFYTKIISAKGTLPHEIFHFIIQMLKPSDLADDRMIINVKNENKPIKAVGMVGFILDEGFVEKLSNEFCEQHINQGEDFYYKIAPQYIPFINVCNYIMNKYPTINYNNIFSIDFEDCLTQLTEEERKQYLDAVCISYAVRHGHKKADDVISARIEKKQLDNKKTAISKKALETTINNLSRLININKEHKQSLLVKYESLSDADIIMDLSTIIYHTIEKNSPFYDYALEIINNYNTSIFQSTDVIKNNLGNMFANEKVQEETKTK